MARSVPVAVASASACAVLGLGVGLRCRSGASGAFLAQAAQLRRPAGELRGAASASSRRATLQGGGREACLATATVLLAAAGAGSRRKRGAVARAAEERTLEEREADPFGLLDEDIERDEVGFRTSIFGGDRPPALAVEVIPGLFELVDTKEDPADFEPRNQIGATLPLGFFDPLEFSKKGDKLGFRKLRVAELKHGRVAMMAVAGAVLQHYYRFIGFEEVKADGLQALLTIPGIAGMAVLTAGCGYLELGPWKDRLWKRVGDFGDPGLIGLFIPAADGQVGTPEMRTRELNNGRLAMISAAGIIAAELATGKAAMQQLGL